MPQGLLDYLRKSRAQKAELKMLVLGLDNAGKTTIMKSMVDEEITNISPTQVCCLHSSAVHSA